MARVSIAPSRRTTEYVRLTCQSCNRMLTLRQCANDHGTASETWEMMKQWDEIFLKDARQELNKDMSDTISARGTLRTL